jgi:uncharacterized membrane protein YhaH (DUF805 family)
LTATLSGNTAVDPGTPVVEPKAILSLVVLAVRLANTGITFALCVKRLHDRDSTGWRLVWQSLTLALAVILIVMAYAVAKEQALLWYTLAGVVVVAAFTVSIWLFVEIGFLRRTQDLNRFGPDPLGAAKADTELSGTPSSDTR